MEVNGLEQINVLLNLYFSRFNKNQNEYGTIYDIAREVSSTNSYIRTFLMGLAKEGILKEGHIIFVKGKNVMTYEVDKQKLLEFLIQLPIFKKNFAIIYDNYDNFWGNLPQFYTKKEMEEIKELLG